MSFSMLKIGVCSLRLLPNSVCVAEQHIKDHKRVKKIET